MPYALSTTAPDTGLVLVRHVADHDPRGVGKDNRPEGAAKDPAVLASTFVDEVSRFPGIAVGWIRNADGSFVPFALPLDQVRAQRLAALDQQCRAAIVGGFTSAALGAPHLYGSSPTDQSNLDADMMAASQADGASLAVDLDCSADGGATWAAATHNQVQVGQVWRDFHVARRAALAKKRDLATQVLVGTQADLDALTW